ncbi:MAG: PilZ domain-containing protein [Armatimonadetes bacterium]|nr:PilZ domain-containing protein [Armatimonadota bacterium]
MFEFLKGWRKKRELAPDSTLVGVSHARHRCRLTAATWQEVSFITDTPEDVGTMTTLLFSIHHQRFPKPEEVAVKVEILDRVQVTRGNYEHQAALVDAPDHIRYLLVRQFFDVNSDEPVEEVPENEQRQAPRWERTFQVISRQLSRFKALACDISQTGVRLEADTPEPVGHTFEMTLDFDAFDLPVLENLKGQIMWCRPDPKERLFSMGVRFVEPTPEQAEIIQKYLEILARAKKELKTGSIPIQ